jgi:excinuclease UvrABC nuclease subunit
VDGITEDAYRERVDEALKVFDRSADSLRAELQRRHDAAARIHRHDDQIRYRDALKALDRSMSGLRLVRSATSRFGLAIVEAEEDMVAVMLVRHGYLAKTLRLRKSEWGTPAFEGAVRRALRHAYFSGPYADDPVDYNPQQLKDIFLIESYRHQRAPLELEIERDADEDETATALLTLLRRHLRVTRRRHVLTAGA